MVYNSEFHRVLVSSQERRSRTPSGDFLEQGEIFRIHLNRFDQPMPMRITGRDDFPFHPAGIAIIDSGRPVLLVVNRAIKQVTVIEKFMVKQRDLEYYGRIFSPHFSRSEYIAAASENEFFVTNTRPHSAGSALVQTLTGIKLHEIVYYNGGESYVASTSSRHYTGLALSPDRQTVYAGTAGGNVLALGRTDSGMLHLQATFAVGGFVENIYTERAGSLLVSSVNSRFKYFLHRLSPAFRAASRVWRMQPENGQKELVYADGATRVSGLGASIHLSDRLVLGQKFAASTIGCRM